MTPWTRYRVERRQITLPDGSEQEVDVKVYESVADDGGPERPLLMGLSVTVEGLSTALFCWKGQGRKTVEGGAVRMGISDSSHRNRSISYPPSPVYNRGIVAPATTVDARFEPLIPRFCPVIHRG